MTRSLANSVTSSDYMTLEIKNFGPISRGTINLKPLTILVGPNGCGKTHTAMLLHTIVDTESERYVTQAAPEFRPSVRQARSIIRRESIRVFQEHKSSKHNLLNSDIYNSIAKLNSKIFTQRLEQNFSTKPNDLIRIGQESCVLNIHSKIINTKFTCASNDFKLRSTSKSDLKIKFVKYDKPPEPKNERGYFENGIVHVDIPHFADEHDISHYIINALNFHRRKIRKIIRSTYFPAERAGLTLAHKTLVLNYYERLGDLHLDPVDPQITNIMANFLSWLTRPPTSKKKMANIATEFEKQALNGEIITKPDITKSLDIYFRSMQRDFPLHTAASSVKDLAAFLLFIKFVARKGDMIILEEPETNLHLGNQLKLGRFVARLINEGLYVVITTHSVHLLEQLSHLVLASTAKNETGAEMRVNKTSLKVRDVAAYHFQAHDNGYEILPIPVTDDEGIPQNEFIRIEDELYEELTDLRQTDE